MRRIGCVRLMSAPGAIVSSAPARGASGPPPSDPQRALREIALEFSPRVEEAELGLVYVDLTGVQGLFGDERAIAESLRRRAAVRGLEVRVGIGGSRASARVAARWVESAPAVAPGEDAAALAPAPLALLDGDPDAPALLRRWGLRTLGELAALPAVSLFERLGREGLRLRDLARGVDRRPLAPWQPPRLVEASVDLDWEASDLAAIGELVWRLAGEVAAGLAREDQDAGRLEWSLRLCDGSLREDDLTPAAPTREPAALVMLVRRAIESRPPPAAVTGMTLRAYPVRVARAQPSFTDPPRPSARTLAEVLSRLGALVGAGRVGAPELRDTHRPDAMTLEPVRESPAPARAGGARTAAREATGRGLTGRGLALRRVRPPARAAVRLAAGRPAHVSAGALAGPVVASVGPWRSSGEWWRDDAWRTDEWDAELEDGTLCRLAHDGAAWFLDGVYD